MDNSGGQMRPGLADTLHKHQMLERQLDEVQRIARVGIWEFQVDADRFAWSHQAARIMGFDPERTNGSPAALLAMIHPEDRERVEQAIALARAGRYVPDFAHRVLLPDGETRHIHVRAHGARNARGEAVVWGTVQDVSTQHASGAALEAVTRRLSDTVESMAEALCAVDRQWRLTAMNRQAEQLLGRPRSELLGKVLWDEFPRLRNTRFENALRQVLEQDKPTTFEGYDTRLGRWRELRVFPTDEGLAVFFTDITEQKRLREQERAAADRFRLLASLLDKAHDAISVTGIDSRITYWNRGAERMFGWTAAEVLGERKSQLMILREADFLTAYQTVLERGEWTGEIGKRHKDGRGLAAESHLTLVRDDEGRPQAVLEIETDITLRKAAEREILSLAFFDPLTRLPNRRLLLDRLRHALAGCKRDGHSGALLFLDLDNFKSLNDTLGHDKGDQLLRQVARRLQQQVPRASDTVARHGGDEFVVVLEDLSSNREDAAAQAERMAGKLVSVFDTPFRLDGHQHHTSPSIGIALFDEHIDNVDELLKRADLAMYQAKAAGRNTIRFFDAGMQTVVNARVELEHDLRSSLARGEFRLHYQRQTDAAGRTIGAEALLRWRHPRREEVAPAQFIPLAEETGLIMQLGQWVLETACKQLVTWGRNPDTAHLTVAVNVSARQFRQPSFVRQVFDVLDRTGADPGRLKLELTESLLVANVENTVENMNALKARGIAFALDDFGTGYSSLAYLKRLPLDQLKIDQSFVRDVLTDPNDAAIARTILGLGHTLGLDVIAEGVETASQRDFLAEHGCQAYQGYLFGPPVAADQFQQRAS